MMKLRERTRTKQMDIVAKVRVFKRRVLRGPSVAKCAKYALKGTTHSDRGLDE